MKIHVMYDSHLVPFIGNPGGEPEWEVPDAVVERFTKAEAEWQQAILALEAAYKDAQKE